MFTIIYNYLPPQIHEAICSKFFSLFCKNKIGGYKNLLNLKMKIRSQEVGIEMPLEVFTITG